MNKKQTGEEILNELSIKLARETTDMAADHGDAYMVVTFIPDTGLVCTYTNEKYIQRDIYVHMKKIHSNEHLSSRLNIIGFRCGVGGLETSVFKLTFCDKYATIISDLNKKLGGSSEEN
jgi:hypothetical protein